MHIFFRFIWVFIIIILFYQVQSPKKESAARKKKFSLLNHANKGKNEEAEEKESNKGGHLGKPPLDQSKAAKCSVPEPEVSLILCFT